MENQNSAPQEPSASSDHLQVVGQGSFPAKKKFFASPGKKKKMIIAGLAVLLLIGTVGRWLAFGAARGYRRPSFAGTGNVALVVKDFEPMGIVLADAASTARNGYGATYDALMKEAAQKGADAIINVNISSTGIFFNRTWSGSALAVKYLDSVPEGIQVYSGISDETALLMRGGRQFGRTRF